MPIVNQQNEQEKAAYQSFVEQATYTAITQDPQWAHVKDNWEPLEVYLEEDQKIVAAMSILMIEQTEGQVFAYVSKGPAVNEQSPQIVDRLIAEAEATLREKNVFLLRMDPEWAYSEEVSEAFREAGYHVRNRNVSGKATIQPRYTMRVDLRAFSSDEELMASFYGKTRYRIRYALKNGLTYRLSDNRDDLAIFYDLHKKTSERHGISYRPFSYFERLADAFLERGLMRIVIVEVDGKPDAAGLDFAYGNYVWYMYAGSTHENQVLMAPYLVNWVRMQWALALGKEFYDLGGVFAPDNSDSLYQFKYMFTRPNGATEYIGEIDKVFNEEYYQTFLNK